MTASPEALLDVRELSCGYPGRTVLHEVSFSVRRGEVVSLLGPNGSGKSTLLKTLSKAIPGTGGEVRLEGQNLAGMGSRRLAQLIGYVPQQETPAFDFTVREVVLMGRMPHSDGLFETREDLELADEAMKRADCWEFADRPISALSGGEAQRARIARALAQEAPLLLLDEPISHLDVKHQLAISSLLKDLAAEGIAVIAAVHDLNWAAMIGARAVLLHGGRVVHDGSLAEAHAAGTLDRVYGVRFLEASYEGDSWCVVPVQADRD